eukprot:Opistho-2@71113
MASNPVVVKIVPPSGPNSGGYEAVVIGQFFPENATVLFGSKEAVVTERLGPRAVAVRVPQGLQDVNHAVQVTVAGHGGSTFSYIRDGVSSSRPTSASRKPLAIIDVERPRSSSGHADVDAVKKPLPPIGHGGGPDDGLLVALAGASGSAFKKDVGGAQKQQGSRLGVSSGPIARSPSPFPDVDPVADAKRNAMRQRIMRVFVSSTFRDMAEERDYLAKHVFPELKALADERMVHLTYCDLRWGINEEQSSRFETISICLRELVATDVFICMLGDRYGWHQDPTANKKDVILQRTFDHAATEFPFVDSLRTRSLTELEIRHAALNSPCVVEKAKCRFFFRDRDDTLSRIPAGTDATVFSDSQSYARSQLAALKEEIVTSGLPVTRNYRGVEAVGEEVLSTVRATLDERFPKGSEPTKLHRERQMHESFADIRSRVYIGGEHYYDKLDSHAAATENPFLCVLGPSGSGKSSLVANWIVRFRRLNPDALVIMHFIGCSHESTSVAAILLRMMGELKESFGIDGDLPTDPEGIILLFPTFIARLEEHKDRKVIIVLDALNQLENDSGALQLGWLPTKIPSNLRIVLSAIDNDASQSAAAAADNNNNNNSNSNDVSAGKAAIENEKETIVVSALRKREIPSLRVAPLNSATQQQLAKDFLRAYNK